MMSARQAVWTGVLAVLVAVSGASVAPAADLSGDAYDDPRYADIYGDGPPPRDHTYRDHDDAYDRYSRKDGVSDHDLDDDQDRYAGDHCVPRHLIRRDLQAHGWRDFQDLELRGSVALIQARRPSGRLFDLKVDRCSGAILHARPLDGPGYGHDRDAYGQLDGDRYGHDRRWADVRRHWR